MDDVMGCHRKPEAAPLPSAWHRNLLVAQTSSLASMQPTTITQDYKGYPGQTSVLAA